MIAAIGVLLILAGFSTIIIGLVRKLFPATEKLVPEDLKNVFSLRYGVYYLLAGLLLISI